MLEDKNNRESNIELYRIIIMLLIVAHHYVVNSDLLECIYAAPNEVKSIYLAIFGAWGKIGINCFVLITGYYMCKSKITIKKFLKLLLEVLFYNFVIYTIFVLTKNQEFTIKSFIKNILPIIEINRNFTGCYLAFYLLIPFLNILINNMNEKNHIALISILLFIFSVLGNIPGIYININYITLYCIIYLIAAYIRCYPHDLFFNKKFWRNVLIIAILLCIMSVIFGLYIWWKTNKNLMYYFVNDSNKILAIITSICLFLYFKNLKIKSSKFINSIAASTFGVLCIHANSDTMRTYLWKKTLNNVGVFKNNEYNIFLHSIMSVLVVFSICVVIDQIRIKFVEKKFFEFYDKKIMEKINKYKDLVNDKINNKLRG